MKTSFDTHTTGPVSLLGVYNNIGENHMKIRPTQHLLIIILLFLSFTTLSYAEDMKIQLIEKAIAELKLEKMNAEFSIKKLKNKNLNKIENERLEAAYYQAKLSIDEYVDYSILILNKKDSPLRIDTLNEIDHNIKKNITSFYRVTNELKGKRGTGTLIRVALREALSILSTKLSEANQDDMNKIKDGLMMIKWKEYKNID